MGSDSDSEESSTKPSDSASPPPTWIDAMEDIFESAVDHQAEIEVELDNMDVSVPLQLGENPSSAEWKLNGTVRVRFDGISGPLAEWLRYYAQGELPTPSSQDEHSSSHSDEDSE